MTFITGYISVGSNIGDRENYCRQGISVLDSLSLVSVLEISKFYMTEPVDYTDQDWFVNAVIKIETGLDPVSLLKELKQIEADAGRVGKTIRFGPRKLDFDIILLGDLVLNTKNLEIPHPRMHKRCFVLKPFCDIGSDVVHPVFGKSIKELLANVNDGEQKVVLVDDYLLIT